MDFWPHQEQGVSAVQEALGQGHRRILLTSPTGGGKTAIACRLISDWLGAGLKSVLYTNRRMLVEQTSRVLRLHGINLGVRAAGYSDQRTSAPRSWHCSKQQGQTGPDRRGCR